MEDQPDRPETEQPELIQLRNKVGTLEREAAGKDARIKQNEIDLAQAYAAADQLTAENRRLAEEAQHYKQAAQSLIDSVRAEVKQYGLEDSESLANFIARLHASAQ
jgi:hypothetical protein